MTHPLKVKATNLLAFELPKTYYANCLCGICRSGVPFVRHIDELSHSIQRWHDLGLVIPSQISDSFVFFNFEIWYMDAFEHLLDCVEYFNSQYLQSYT